MIEIQCKNCKKIFIAENRRFKLCNGCKRNKRLESCRRYKKNNREKISNYNRNYKNENKSSISSYNKLYNKVNRNKIQVKQTLQHSERRKTDIKYRMSIILRNRFRKFYKGKRNKTKDIIGISYDDYLKWIEFNFIGDMSWKNHGKLWHIDHIVPCSWFDSQKEDDNIICFNWTNTRPLYASLNLSRKNAI